MPSQTLILLTFLQFFLPHSSSSSSTIFNIMDFNACPDAKSDSSIALLMSWSLACASSNPSTLYIPRGKFLISDVLFIGPCKNSPIRVQIVGTLVAPNDYNVVADKGYLLHFQGLDGLLVFGGTVDGQGTGLWACKKTGKICPLGATNLGISNSKNVMVSGLTSLNSQMFHVVVHSCQNVKIQGVRVRAPADSPNTDGIHVQLSTGVSIINSWIGTGDDCISIGPGTAQLWVHNVGCGPGHGISIGSLGRDYEEAGVEDVTVKNVVFTGTQNGIRIKTWGRPSNGSVRRIVYRRVVMVNVRYPIVIDQNYCPNHRNCPDQVSGVKIREVRYEDVKGTSSSEVAVKFDCSRDYPCEGIRMADVELSYMNMPALALCANAAGSTAGRIEPTSCLL